MLQVAENVDFSAPMTFLRGTVVTAILKSVYIGAASTGTAQKVSLSLLGRLRLAVSVICTGGVLPEMVPCLGLCLGFAGLDALARRVIVRWAGGDNPMRAGSLRTAYVGLTLLVASHRAVSSQRILPYFQCFLGLFHVLSVAQLLRRYYQRTGGPEGGDRYLAGLFSAAQASADGHSLLSTLITRYPSLGNSRTCEDQ